MTTRIIKHKGQYNICSTDEQWCIKVFLPDDAPKRVLDETWNAEDEPNIKGLPPSRVVELIAARLESYLISGGRTEARNLIDWCRIHSSRLDAEWAADQIAAKRKGIEALEREIKDLSDCLEE